MMPVLCALLACTALGVEGVRVVNKYPQTSIPLTPETVTSSPDLPLNKRPLVRTVTHFQPEGIHLTQWTHNSVLVSWQTGGEKIGNNANPPKPYKPSRVAAFVKYGTKHGQYNKSVKGMPGHSLVYSYVYGSEAGNTTYQSPIIHHVLLRCLRPGTTYFYRVGNNKQGWSRELWFKTLKATFPVRLGLIGDLGQTSNSTVTLQQLTDSRPDAVVLVGDFTYADNHLSGDSTGTDTHGNASSSDQPRWDSWARMTEPLLSSVPLISCRGNHEIEGLVLDNLATFKAAAARYPYPQNPAVIDTAANHASVYLNKSNVGQFLNEGTYQPRSAYYSLNLPGVAHIISLNNYIPWGHASAQYEWFKADLAEVDRHRTPWLIVIFHASPYHTYVNHYKEGDAFMHHYERLFYKAGVDLVFSGHVHSYERTNPIFNYTRDSCGPMYTCIGDGGNIEGLAYPFIDMPPVPSFCANASLFQLPNYQPTPSGRPTITLQHGRFCPSRQPAWSAFRQPSFGHGILEIQSANEAVFRWHRNINASPVVVDEAIITRGGSAKHKCACG